MKKQDNSTLTAVKAEQPDDISAESCSKSDISDQKLPFTNIIGMEFTYIYPGTFMMGSPEDTPYRHADEKLHKVTLTKGFFMQITEVTQGQWKKVMGNNPSYFKNCGDNCPVEKVSWYDVQKFIKKLNKMDNSHKYRLPTEAEWEYACRSGSKTSLYTGNVSIKGLNHAPELDAIAWYGGNSGVDYDGGDDSSRWLEKQYKSSYSGPHPVRMKEPNKWGLYDMLGNVWEWCADWYEENYPSVHVTDPSGPDSGNFHVLRGGGWNNYAKNCHCADRRRYEPDSRASFVGFRLVAYF